MIKFNDSVKYSAESDEYSVQMKEKKFPWWLLLFLLPLLLLVKCNKTITVYCYENESKVAVANQSVTLSYDTLVMSRTTDTSGVAVFDSLKTSVFGYVCLFWKKCTFSAISDCYSCDSLIKNFHYTRHVDMPMTPRRVNLHVKLLDKETGDILPDGTVVYTYNENGLSITDSVKTDAAGVVEIPNMRYCSKIDLLAKCYGYADTVKLQTPCNENIIADDSSAMRLRPIKERFTFFVKNKETKEPIPNAVCSVVLTNPNGSERERRDNIKTSTEGKGMAFFDNAFIRATIAIHAEKTHFKPGDLEGGPFTVTKFIKQPDDVRTVWLEPEPFVVEFQTVDSITGKPIVGAKVHITIIDPNGTKTETDEVSNSPNGIFPVKAKENSKIIIEAKKQLSYKDKKRIIEKFSESVDKKVRMEPDMVTLQFRTTDGVNVLPNCNLKVNGSISGSLKPSNSGSGVFNVTFRKDELLSIVASKTGYSTNSTKVKNASYNQLGAQSARDIPLKKSWRYDYNQTSVFPGFTERKCYDLYEAPITFTFTLHQFCNSDCTTIKVQDANGNLLAVFSNTDSAPITRRLTSQTREVCVSVVDKNGHVFHYSLSQ